MTEVKYLPIQKNGAVEIYPLEVNAQSKDLSQESIIDFCDSSIKSYLKKAKENRAFDLKDHKRELIRTCKNQIERLSEADQKFFSFDSTEE